MAEADNPHGSAQSHIRPLPLSETSPLPASIEQMAHDLATEALRKAAEGNQGDVLALIGPLSRSGVQPARLIEIAHTIEKACGIDAAFEIFNELLAARPDHPEIMMAAAKLAFRADDLVTMTEFGSKAVSAAPANASIVCDYAELLRDGDYAVLSLRLLANAIAQQGPQADYLRHTGLALAMNCDARGWYFDQAQADEILSALFHFPQVKALRDKFELQGEPAPQAQSPLATPLATLPATLPATQPANQAQHDQPAIAPEPASFELAEPDVTTPAPAPLTLSRPSPGQTVDAALVQEIEAVEDLRKVPAGTARDWARRAVALNAVLPLFQSAIIAGAAPLIAACLEYLPQSADIELDDCLQAMDILRAAGSSQDILRTALEGSVRAFPDHPILLAELAKVLLQSHELSAALVLMQRAHASDPNSPGITALLTDVHWQMDDHASAFGVLEAQLERQPDDQVLRLKLAGFAHWDDQNERAAALLDTIDESQLPEDARDFFLTLLMSRGRGKRADNILQTAATEQNISPSRRAVNVIRSLPALIWPLLPGRVDERHVAQLIEALDSAQPPELTPDDIWRNVLLFAKLCRTDQAFALVERGLKARHAPDETPCEQMRALINTLLDDEELQRAASLGTDACAQALNTRGLAWQATGSSFESRCCFRIAHALAPQSAPLAINCGFAATAAGDVLTAMDAFAALERHYDKDMAQVAWPAPGNRPWPYRKPPLAAEFDALRGDTRQWPKITIITPSFNQGQFIEETILSVLNQDYPAIEYIVVDGQSRDDTAGVLDQYRSRLAHVIIEPDNGQTDAINKGLALATGELITWLNSDDMLAPGALHALALRWLDSRADLLFGACLPHRNYRFELANMPAVRQETFTPQHLGEIFGLWLKGHFFYQPEVIFTRELLQRAGGRLDESLNYTMDYEFWMRCAGLSARIEAVHWPIALFRHHDEQKTRQLADCIIEQGIVRDRFVAIAPAAPRLAEIRTALARATKAPLPRLGLVTSRLDKIFSPDTGADLQAELSTRGLDVHLAASAAALPDGMDAIIKFIHLQNDQEDIGLLRKRFPGAPLAGWFWDNHHNLFDNHDVASLLDVVIPGHLFASAYLRNTHALHLDHTPLCVTQWSRSEARYHYQTSAMRPRSNELYGGFVRYNFAERRNHLIAELIASGMPAIYFLDEGALEPYFGLSQGDRFAQWCSYKTSLCLPLHGDISQRLFDALLAGHAPVVSPDLHDLDAVIPPALRERLSIVVMRDNSPEAVREAHARAIELFNQCGPGGISLRHRYALEHHTMPARIIGLWNLLREQAAG